MAEPLAVCLHAVDRAGPLLGRRVLIAGCGPIGALVIMAAKHAGASEIVATDVQELGLTTARKAGADRAINVAGEPEALAAPTKEEGPFDVLFEASGNAVALRNALDHLRPRGVVVQVGPGGDVSLPMNTIVTRELDIRGTFRFDAEFALAVELMGSGRIDVKSLISASVPFRDALEAFSLASDRSRAVKVQLTFA